MRKTVWALAALLIAQTACAKEKKMTDGNLKTAIFAGGCFWCMEPPFEHQEGVTAVMSGYTGGQNKNPTYEEVSSGRTGHAEAIQITYDPKVVTYQQLLDIFWQNIDPTATNRQFADVGTQYRAEIYYQNDEEKRLAEASKKALADSKKFSKPIMVQIVAASEFYPAEDYHQDYYKKNPIPYNRYKVGSGRAGFLEENWGKKDH